jgi:hypothetical protein
MRKQCANAAKKHIVDMKTMIAKHHDLIMDASTGRMEHLIKVEESCLRTRFELESALYHRFDVRKANRQGQRWDNKWYKKVDDFLERERNPFTL